MIRDRKVPDFFDAGDEPEAVAQACLQATAPVKTSIIFIDKRTKIT